MKKFLVLTATIASLSCTVAFASDDTIIQSQEGSIISFGCVTCNAEIVDNKTKLETGSQVLEKFQVNGEDKVYRTENWLGGSPVSFVHYQPESKSNGAALANLDKPMQMDKPILAGESLTIDLSTVSSVDGNLDVIKEMAPDTEIMMEKQMVKNPMIQEPAIAKLANETNMLDMKPEPKMMEKPIIATMTETKDLEANAFTLRLN
jgi:hypothetical protein